MRRILIPAVVWLGNLHRRALALFFAVVGPRIAYKVSGWGALLIYRLLVPLRERSEAQCEAALKGRVPAEEIPKIAEKSFVNRARNLTDLMLASHFLRPQTFERYGGGIPEPHRSALLEGQRRRQAIILVTAYYGSFDLLPIFLGYNGIRATVVYLPHGNEGYDAYRKKIRGQSGCEMVSVERAATRLGQVLGEGGTIGIVADHHVADRGMPVTFMGLPTKALRTVGLLAWRYQANVVVAAIRRLGDTFRFGFVIADILDHRDIGAQDDAVTFVTTWYLQAMERIVLEDPTQYLWAYARWGEDYARGLPGCRSAPFGGVGDGQPQADG